MSSTSISPCDGGEVEKSVAFLLFLKDFFLSVEVGRLDWQSVTTAIGLQDEEGVLNVARGGTKGFYRVMAWARASLNLLESIFQGGMLSGELLTYQPTKKQKKLEPQGKAIKTSFKRTHLL